MKLICDVELWGELGAVGPWAVQLVSSWACGQAQRAVLALMSLSAPPVASSVGLLGWKSRVNTGSLPCHTICSVLAFIFAALLN